MNYARWLHTATRLQDGKVLVASYGSAEVYNPDTATWTLTGAMADNRDRHQAILLPNGKVLAVGGNGPYVDGLTSAELYNPVTSTWTATASLNIGRTDHTLTLLPNGKVLATAGSDGDDTPYNTAELWQP